MTLVDYLLRRIAGLFNEKDRKNKVKRAKGNGGSYFVLVPKTWITANGTLYEADFFNRRFTPARSAQPPKGVWLEPVVPDMEEDADGNIWLAKWGVGPLFYDRKANLLSYLEGDNFRDDPNQAYMLCADRARRHIWICTTWAMGSLITTLKPAKPNGYSS